ncbi:MAG: hypothetical protein HW405_374 [Candidatus Berkelbacteria bacterium]|nr:hypothetical protein [Candidatus Berkelbacteria bacterium]
MNIGIAANTLIFEKAGIGQYGRNLLKELLKIDKKNHYFLYFSFIRHRKPREKEIDSILGLPRASNVTVKIIPIPAAWLDFITTTPFSIQNVIKDKIDVFFAPYAAGIPKKGFSKMVFMCHDLVFMRFPEHRGKRLSNYYLKRHEIAIQNCSKIIVPSQSTRKDLREFFNVPLKKIVYIPEAADKNFRPIKDRKEIERITSKYIDPKYKYILSVGTLEPRKNLAKLVEAYSLLPHEILRQYRLILVGAKGWNNSVLERTINDLNLQDKVILAGFVKDEDLPYIYNGASIFVYPSLYEGFGLPPLEALACGVPTVVCDRSSLSEVVGKAGILVNPENEKEISLAIKRILSRPILQEKSRRKGLLVAKKYSWKKTAEETLKVIENL